MSLFTYSLVRVARAGVYYCCGQTYTRLGDLYVHQTLKHERRRPCSG